MYTSVEQVLAQHYAAISDLLADAASQAGGHYAEMSVTARRLHATHDAAELIHALTEGRIDRQAVQANSARPPTPAWSPMTCCA